uniref:Putative secreted peptide n=1 Tax=Anopheles braziliensis TaxID=58242 RepID=A0A2M3ZV39_9DIPT
MPIYYLLLTIPGPSTFSIAVFLVLSLFFSHWHGNVRLYCTKPFPAVSSAGCNMWQNIIVGVTPSRESGL